MSKIEEARAAGYSDDEILSHMAKSKPKLADALKEGYSATEILSHLGNKSAPAPQEAPAAPAAKQERSLGNAVATGITNLPSSIGKVIGGTVDAVTSPVQTASSMGDLARGAIMKIPGAREAMRLPPETTERADNAVNSLVNSYKDKYGSWAGFKESLAQDPAGILLDASAVFTGGATLAPKAGQVANALNKAAAVTNPLAPVQAITNKLASGGASVAGKAMDIRAAPELAAANIARQAAGDDLGLIQAANRANPDAPAGAVGVGPDAYQSLASRGVDADVTPLIDEVAKYQSQLASVGDRLPQQYRMEIENKINQLNNQIGLSLGASQQSIGGSARMNQLLEQNTPSLPRLPDVPTDLKYGRFGIAGTARTIGGASTIANKGLAALEGKIQARTLDALDKGMRTGKSTNELLALVPAAERNTVIKFIKSNPKWLTNSGVNAMVQGTNVLDQSMDQSME